MESGLWELDFIDLARAVSTTNGNTPRRCSQCSCVLRSQNRGKTCSPCWERHYHRVRQDLRLNKPRPRPDLAHLVALYHRRVIRRRWCWGWKGAVDWRGTALVVANGFTYSARRISFEVHRGTAPVGSLKNSCNRNECTNPRHVIPTKGNRK